MGFGGNFKISIWHFCRINPAALICLGLLNGVIPLLTCRSFPPFILLIMSLLVSVPCLLISRNFFAKFAIFSILGHLLTYCALSPSTNDYSRIISTKNCGAEIRIQISDTLVPGEDILWLSMPSAVKGKLIKMRYSRFDAWHKVTGTLALKFPRDARGFSFGDVLQIEGAFVEPESRGFTGGFDYKQHLLTLGIRKIFIVDKYQVLSGTEYPLSFYTRCQQLVLGIRDGLMNRMVEGMGEKQKRTIAAILFGCRQGLDYASRTEYMQSGVIHIFAISGLHVGMLSLALYLCFCWVPFRIRHLLIPVFLFFYVYSTGMQASAMRAFLMISVWSIHRSALRPISPLNAVFLAAVIVIIINPMTILGAGFQYSFTIAGFLVLSWHSSKRWFAFLEEKNLWNPAYGTGFIFYFHRFRNTALSSLICSFIAWLAGSGLNMVHHNFFIPGAVATNFLILPFVWVFFLVAVLEILLLPLQGILGISNIMEYLVRIINELSFAGALAGQSRYLPSPPFWVLGIFFFSLGLMITATRKKVFYGGFLLVMFNIIYWNLQTIFFNDKIKVAVFHGGGSQLPSFVSMSPGNKIVNVINTGSKKQAKLMLDYLTSKGINKIDMLCFTKAGKESADGAWLLLSRLKVRLVIFPYNYRQSWYTRTAMESAAKSGAYIDFFTLDQQKHSRLYEKANFNFEQTEGEWSFVLSSPNCKIITAVKQEMTGGKELSLKINNDIPRILVMDNSNTVTMCEINK